MLARKVLHLLFVLVFLFIYVNLSLSLPLLLFEFLPRILNTLLLFFVFPILLGVGFMYLERAVLSQLSRLDPEYEMPEPGISVFLFLSLILWLFILTGHYLEVREYLQMAVYKRAYTQDIGAPSFDRSRVAHLTIEKARTAPALHGVYQMVTTVKSGETPSKQYNDYLAFPLFGDDGDRSRPVRYWICEWISNPRGVVKAQRETSKILSGEVKGDAFPGYLVTDPYAGSHYKKAVADAVHRHGLKSHDDPVLLELTPPYPELISALRSRFLIFLGISNGLLWLLPCLVMLYTRFSRRSR